MKIKISYEIEVEQNILDYEYDVYTYNYQNEENFMSFEEFIKDWILHYDFFDMKIFPEDAKNIKIELKKEQ